MVLQQQLFITVELKIGTLYPRMSNKSALSMVSNLLQDNTLDLNCNLWNLIPMLIINMHLAFQFCNLGLCPLHSYLLLGSNQQDPIGNKP